MTYDEGGISIATFDEAWRMAQLFAKSDLVPKDYKDRPENCLTAMQMGAELGFKPMQSLQGIAVINGRPSVWGDALWALVQSCPVVIDSHETFDTATMTATCMIHRRGRAHPTVQRYSQADAVVSGLWKKTGPWTQYPQRMLQMRARAFCARDAIPDYLKGLGVAEEVRDIEIDMGNAEVVPRAAQAPQTTEQARATLPEYSADSFTKNLPAWRKAIEGGKKTPADVIRMVSTKHQLTREQIDTITAIKAEPAPAAAPAAAAPAAAQPSGRMTEEQVVAICAKMEQAVISELEVCKHFGVEIFEALPASKFDAVMAFLADPAGSAS
jgi:hypothetical protein